MTAQPDGDLGSYEVVHLGGAAAAIVPLAELRRLQAVQRHASADLLEDAEVEATMAAHRDWVAAGRPGAVSHEVAMAELLTDQCGSSGRRPQESLSATLLSDQGGMQSIGVAVAALAADPYPSEAFHRGNYHRLMSGGSPESAGTVESCQRTTSTNG
jgi:hypothetical protein